MRDTVRREQAADTEDMHEARGSDYASPQDVDGSLRAGMSAFRSRNYDTARDAFRALLIPIAEIGSEIGQEELAGEVLDVDLHQCMAMYVVSVYMQVEPPDRVDAVQSALDDVASIAYSSTPLAAMERAAIEPLPGLDGFVRDWRSMLESKVKHQRGDWPNSADRWLREAVERMDGASGLGELARRSKRAADLRAWCLAVEQNSDWGSALSAYIEAADMVTDTPWARAEFLDGAAFAALQLEGPGWHNYLEQAWRAAPSMLRLRQWLGSAEGKRALTARASAALDACTPEHVRQRAFLHLVLGNFADAAAMLAAAPGLGWSGGEHPGHQLFSQFYHLLVESNLGRSGTQIADTHDEMSQDALESVLHGTEPRIEAASADTIVQLAGVADSLTAESKAVLLDAMRAAATNRVAGVTSGQRRKHYGHAASLVAICASLDHGPQALQWLDTVRQQYRRYPAFGRELGSHLRR